MDKSAAERAQIGLQAEGLPTPTQLRRARLRSGAVGSRVGMDEHGRAHHAPRGRPLVKRPRLLYVVTHAMSADRLLRGQLGEMRRRGYEVYVVASPDPRLARVAAREGVQAFAIPMERGISPLRDLLALGRLLALIARLRPHVVNAGTPKAGLLGMLAAKLGRVPARVYILRGLRLETTEGRVRRLLAATERLASACAQVVCCNSESLRQRYVELGLGSREKTRVLAGGSGNGVRYGDFARTPERLAEAARLRASLALPEGAKVIGFVGRLAPDKGVDGLVAAFEKVVAAEPSAFLLVVGESDPDDPLCAATDAALRAHPRVRVAGFVQEPSPYYALMDVLGFTSFREGFPNVVLEAASAGVPTVGYAATGTVDAIVDEAGGAHNTGWLVPTGDISRLTGALLTALRDDRERRARAEHAERRAREDFAPEEIWAALDALYRELSGVRTGPDGDGPDGDGPDGNGPDGDGPDGDAAEPSSALPA